MRESESTPAGKIAILVAGDFEDDELRVPYEFLQKEGYQCEFIGIAAHKKLKGKHGYEVETDRAVVGVDTDAYAGLVIPGGYAPDQLRLDKHMVFFTRSFMGTGKPVAAICHGPQLLIEADVVANRTMTSWPSVSTDLKNAGAIWVDREVVVDGNLITSRKPDDLDAFCRAFAKELQGSEVH